MAGQARAGRTAELVVLIAMAPGRATVEEPALPTTLGGSQESQHATPGTGAAPMVFWVVAEGRFELPAKGL